MAWDSSNRRSRLPPDWRQRRTAVLQRDGHRCTSSIHTPGCDGTANEVHHLGADDDHRMHMLTSLSTACHKIETQQEAQRARAQRPGHLRTPEAHPGLTR